MTRLHPHAVLVPTLLFCLAADAPRDVMPDRHWDVEHLDLDITVDPSAGTVAGTSTLTVSPLGAPFGALELNQVALQIEEITVDGTPAKGWRVRPNHLSIPVTPSENHTVAIRYSATPQTGMHFRSRDSDRLTEVFTQGEGPDNRHWFPGWDHPSDRFTTSTHLTVPTGLAAFSNGVHQGSEEVEPGWTRHDFALEQPIVNYLVTVTAGEHTVIRDEPDGVVPLLISLPRDRDTQAAEEVLALTRRQVDFFEDLLGAPFPYPNYRQVAVQRFLYGGMENATLTVLDERVLRQEDHINHIRTDEVVAHELAHQWFGDSLTCYGWRELWLNEGFAEYYAWRWQEPIYGPEFAADTVRSWHRRAKRDPAPMAARSWSKSGARDNNAVYSRGASVLFLLERTLGREIFDEAIRTYVAENTNRLVESADLRRALEDASGHHLGWLFDTWVHGTSIPTVETSHRYKEGELVVTIRQKPGEDEVPLHAPVLVEVGTASGTSEHRIWLGPGETRLQLEREQAPMWVAVNADDAVLGRWTHTQSAEEWAAQLTGSPTPGARQQAIAELKDGGTPAAEALLAYFAQDHDPHVQWDAAEALGMLNTPPTLDALLQAADGSDPHRVQAAAHALRFVGPKPDVVRTLQRLALRHPHSQIRADALSSLAKADEAKALVVARTLATQPDPLPHHPSGRGRALKVIGDHGVPGDLALLLRHTRPSVQVHVRHAAVRAASKLVRNQDEEVADRLRGRVSRTVEPLLQDPFVRARQMAIGVLGQVGDDQAALTLQAFARNTTVNSPDLATAAFDAARTIRSREPEGADKASNTEDHERLMERMEALEERVEDLESWR
jgi:aminopeptidase N